ncbi:MAG: hypothetical protein V3T53_05240 [Phycisphaerales bacterium]
MTKWVSTKRFGFLLVDLPGVMPDIRIETQWDDLVNGRDPVLEGVLALVRIGDHQTQTE